MTRQTLTSQILVYKCMVSLWLKPTQSLNFISSITFNSAIRQTLTPPNIPAIRFMHMCMCVSVHGYTNVHVWCVWVEEYVRK